jgi:hypothetical protein
MKKAMSIFLQLTASVSIIMAGLTHNGIAEDFASLTIEDLKKEIYSLRQGKNDPITCAQMLSQIHRIDTLAGKQYFADKELAYLTEKCKPFQPASKTSKAPTKPLPLPPGQSATDKTASTHKPLPKASESSDTRTKVTSALNTLAEGKADKSNCEKRVKLIETFDRLSDVEGKTSYSMGERNYFLKACFSIVPEAAPLAKKGPFTHPIPKSDVQDALHAEIKKKFQQREQKAKESEEAQQDLDKLLDELAADQDNK